MYKGNVRVLTDSPGVWVLVSLRSPGEAVSVSGGEHKTPMEDTVDIGRFVPVTFQVHAWRVRSGDAVFLVGSIPELGAWDVSKVGGYLILG